MSSDEFVKQHRVAPADFTRQRKLPLASVVLFLLSVIRSSLQNELDRFFQAVESAALPLRQVTASAFCQARKKLKPEAFVALNREALQAFYSSGLANLWKGFRLVAIDSSSCRVPDAYDNRRHFGEARGPHGGCPSARMSCAFDPLNELIVDATLAPYREGDRSQALHHLSVCQPGKDLLLFDRGYPAVWFFQLLLSRGLDFCCRVSADRIKALRDFSASTVDDAVLVIPPNRHNEQQFTERGLSFEAVRVRALRLRRPGTDDLLLITSLTDPERYPLDCFEALYHHRWSVEESYKRLVCRLEIASFSGKSKQAIQQDFHAKVFTMNLCALLSRDAREQLEKTPAPEGGERRMNWTHALAKMKDGVVLLFTAESWISVMEHLQDLFEMAYHVYRPERHYERKKNFHRRVHHMAYKDIA